MRFARSACKFTGASMCFCPTDGEPFVLEVNTIPGMTEASLLPEAAAAAGISYVDLCARIIELSRARTEGSSRDECRSKTLHDRAIDACPICASGVSSTCSM